MERKAVIKSAVSTAAAPPAGPGRAGPARPPTPPAFRPARALTLVLLPKQDMSEDMQQDSIDCAAQAMEKFNIEKDIAACESPARRRREDCTRPWRRPPWARPAPFVPGRPGDLSLVLTPSPTPRLARSALAQTSRRSSTKSTDPRGTASWAATSAPT